MDATRHCLRPQIELSAGINEEGKTFIRVSDNGTGIPVEVQDRNSIPFFTTKPSGSGIGLSISRQIMHMHKENCPFYPRTDKAVGSSLLSARFKSKQNFSFKRKVIFLHLYAQRNKDSR
ncbi:MAG: HAMP domain-containing sensor histidine kinase [Parabacteroides johnsonii]